MACDQQLQQVLEELLDSGCTPEEVCRACPELLPQVLERWQQLRTLQAQVDRFFPAPPTIPYDDTPRPVPLAADLPRISGYDVHGVLGGRRSN